MFVIDLKVIDMFSIKDEYKTVVKLREEPLHTWKSFLTSQVGCSAKKLQKNSFQRLIS